LRRDATRVVHFIESIPDEATIADLSAMQTVIRERPNPMRLSVRLLHIERFFIFRTCPGFTAPGVSRGRKLRRIAHCRPHRNSRSGQAACVFFRSNAEDRSCTRQRRIRSARQEKNLSCSSQFMYTAICLRRFMPCFIRMPIPVNGMALSGIRIETVLLRSRRHCLKEAYDAAQQKEGSSRR
jgi:hypothetical protein